MPASLVLLAVAGILLLRSGKHQPTSSISADRSAGAEVSSGALEDVDPTISNYSAVANRSFEQFDELLTRQANKHFARYPVFTAGGVPDQSLADQL
jgi:hypothetical protein